MADPRIEDLFLTYRSTRDPNALAAIFDATASELLLVAVHLVGDRAEAEDLVQTTFVELIERAEQYDASRPLKPWLIGILANRAKMALRRRKRAPTHDLGEPEATAAKTDPLDAAEAEEAARHISRALGELPSHYRHILVLHLVHGLGGVQIAHSLDRPPATVRTQIKRGLEMLRSALPVALAVPAILFVTEGRGLAAVRSAVLQKAGEAMVVGAGVAAGTTVALTAGSVLAMKKVMVAVVCVALGLGAYFGFDSAFADGSPIEVPESSMVKTVDTVALDGKESRPAASKGELAQRKVLPGEKPEATEVIVTGRCIDAETGEPQVVNWLVIRANPDLTSGIAEYRRRLKERQWPFDVASGSSAQDGRFELDFEYETGLRYSIELDGDSFVGLSGGLQIDGPGRCDLGDVEVHNGCRMRGRIVDPDGVPLADVGLLVEFDSPSIGGRGRSTTGVRSGPDGRFRMHGDGRILAGKVVVTTRQGYTLIGPQQFEVTEDSEFSEQTIVVKKQLAAEQIAGRIVDAENRGVGGVKLKVAKRDHDGFIRTYTSGSDGAFVIFRAAADNDRVALIVDGSDETLPLKSSPIEWGATGIELVQKRARQLAIVVTDANTHEPVEDYSVALRWSDDPVGHRSGFGTRYPDKHDNGRLALFGIGDTGTLVILVVPDSDAYAMSDYTSIDLEAVGSAPIQIEVHPRRPIQIEVVDAEHRPVAGAVVQLVQLCRDQELDAETLVLGRDNVFWNLRVRPSDWPHAFELARDKADAAGRATLSCLDAGRRIGLLVTAKGFLSSRITAIALPAPGASYEVELQRSASITGTVDFGGQRSRFQLDPTADLHLGSFEVAIRRPGQKIRRHAGGRESGYPVRSDGSFEIPNIEAGRWELVIHWMRPINTRSAISHVIDNSPLAVVDLSSGQALEVELDATRVLPATIAGVITSDGAPVKDCVVTFTRRFFDKRGKTVVQSGLGELTTDKKGRFAMAGFLPGDYLLQVKTTDSTGSLVSSRVGTWLHLPSGGTVEQAFDVSSRSIRLRLVDGDRKPLARRTVTILCDEFCLAWTRTTSRDGTIEIKDAVNATLRVLLHADGAVHDKHDDWSATSKRKGKAFPVITVPAGHGEHAAVLILH